jgi:hypothetical protein
MLVFMQSQGTKPCSARKDFLTSTDLLDSDRLTRHPAGFLLPTDGKLILHSLHGVFKTGLDFAIVPEAV